MTKRYIDADKVDTVIYALIEIELHQSHRVTLLRAKHAIESIPTADVVEVVRCKDCANWDKTWQPSAEGHYCPSVDLVTKPDFYCGDGKRREDAEID